MSLRQHLPGKDYSVVVLKGWVKETEWLWTEGHFVLAVWKRNTYCSMFLFVWNSRRAKVLLLTLEPPSVLGPLEWS